jgi:hypothetical protein
VKAAQHEWLPVDPWRGKCVSSTVACSEPWLCFGPITADDLLPEWVAELPHFDPTWVAMPQFEN